MSVREKISRLHEIAWKMFISLLLAYKLLAVESHNGCIPAQISFAYTQYNGKDNAHETILLWSGAWDKLSAASAIVGLIDVLG